MGVGILYGLGAASIWGGMYVVSKVVLEVVPPFALLTIRLILGMATLGVALLIKGWKGMGRRDIIQVMGVGFVGYGVSLGFQFVGTKLSTAVNGAVITAATPAFVFLFAYWILGEAITRWKTLALAVSTLGVLVVVDFESARFTPNLLWGNLSLVAAGLTWALYSVLVRKVTRELATLPVSFATFFGGLVLSLPLGAWEIGTQGVGEVSGWTAAGMVYLGVISTGVAMYLWNSAFEKLEAGAASLTFFAQPVVGTILGVIFLGEEVTPLFFLGGLLIGIGIWLAARPEKLATQKFLRG